MTVGVSQCPLNTQCSRERSEDERHGFDDSLNLGLLRGNHGNRAPSGAFGGRDRGGAPIGTGLLVSAVAGERGCR